MLCSLVTRLDGVLVISILIFVSTEVFAQKCANNQGGIELTAQPMDATVCLGGTADFSCDYAGTRSHPQWIINSTLYTSSNLPRNTRYDGASRTLVVSNVTEEQVNVTYQCFLALFNPVNDSICFLLSSIGKIKVNTSVVSINVRRATEEVCITCLPDNSNTGPVDNYLVTVSDISGSEVYRAIVSNPICMSAETSFQPPECAPFVVSVNPTNSAEFIGNTSKRITLDEEGDTCSCVKKRVSIDLVTKISTETIQANLYCHRIDYVSGVQFEVEINHNGSTPKLVNCDGLTLEFTGLNCNNAYNISAYWRSPINDTVLCLVDQTYGLSPVCGNNDVITGGGSNTLLWLISIPVFFVLVIGGIIIELLILICCGCLQCKTCRKYKFEEQEQIGSENSDGKK